MGDEPMYMVRPPLWRQAIRGIPNNVGKGRDGPKCGDNLVLHLKCLESRINRPLQQEDFNSDLHVNDWIFNDTMQEGIASTVGHLTLDLLGLIPGAGEFADGANVLWYAKQAHSESDPVRKRELIIYAALSLVAIVPAIGDAVGKGSKVALYLGKGAKVIATVGKFIKNHPKIVNVLLTIAGKNKKLSPYVGELRGGLKQLADSSVKIKESYLLESCLVC